MSNGFQLHLLLLFVVAVGGGVADCQLATVGAALVLPVSHGSIREALSNLRVNRRSSHLRCVCRVRVRGRYRNKEEAGRERQGGSKTDRENEREESIERAEERLR